MIQGLDQGLGQAAQKVNMLRLSLGAIGAATALGVAAIGGEALRAAADFQASMVTIQNAAHLSSGATAALGKSIEMTSIGTSSSANEMAAALAPIAGELKRVEGANLSAAATTGVLRAAEELTVSTHGNLAGSLKAITDLLLVYHEKAGDAATISTQLFQAQTQLGIPVGTLAAMLQRLQPRLVGSGIDLKTLLATIREMEPTVGTGARAMMTMGQMLTMIVQPSAKATSYLDKMGLSLKDSKGNFIGLGPALDVLNRALNELPPHVAAGSKELDRATFLQSMFGRQGQIAATLIKGGSAALAENSKELAKNGSAADAAARQAMTLPELWKQIQAAVGTAMTALGGPGVAAMSGFVKQVSNIVDAVVTWIVKNPQLADTILLVVGGLGAFATAVALLSSLFAPLIGIVGILSAPLLAIAAGLLAVTGASGALGPGIQKVVNSLISFAKQMLPVVAKGLADAFNALVGFGRQVVSWIQTQAPLWLAQLARWAKAFVDWVAPMIPVALAALAGLALQIVGWIGRAWPGFVSALVSWVDAFTGWVSNAANQVITALPGMISQIVNWLITNAPSIGAGALQLGAQLLTSLVNGVTGHPEVLAAGIVVLLGAAVVSAAIDAAGAAAGAAYTAATVAAAYIGAAIGSLWSSLKAAVAAVPGALAGAAYSAAVKVAGVLTDIVGALWNVLKTAAQLLIPAGVGTAAGAAYQGAVKAAAAVVDVLTGLWGLAGTGSAVVTEAGAAGAAAGAAYQGGFIAALGPVAAILGLAAVASVVVSGDTAKPPQLTGMDAFTASYNQMTADLAAGRITLDQYRQGIQQLQSAFGITARDMDRLIASGQQLSPTMDHAISNLKTLRTLPPYAGALGLDIHNRSSIDAAGANAAASRAALDAAVGGGGGGGGPYVDIPTGALPKAKKVASTIAQTIQSELAKGWSGAKTAADAYFSAVEQNAISAAGVQKTAADAAAQAWYDASVAQLQAPINQAQKALSAQQAMQQQIKLTESLVSAQDALKNLAPGTDPTQAQRAVRDAQWALSNFMSQQAISSQQQTVDTTIKGTMNTATGQMQGGLDQQLAAMKAHDAQVAAQAVADAKDKYSQDKTAFDRALGLLQLSLGKVKDVHGDSIAKIKALYDAFGLTFLDKGATIANNLAKGLKIGQINVIAAVGELVAAMENALGFDKAKPTAASSAAIAAVGGALTTAGKAAAAMAGPAASLAGGRNLQTNPLVGAPRTPATPAAPVTGTGGMTPLGSAAPGVGGGLVVNVYVTLDDTQMQTWISKVVAEEQRQWGGPVAVGKTG